MHTHVTYMSFHPRSYLRKPIVSVFRRYDRVFGIETAIIRSHHSGSAQFAIRRVLGQVLNELTVFSGTECR